ncbi:lysozyme [Moellerella wisconsensis]|uniref:lysozyme n=1 Tax=Moellerella wisconsensis TaxID=158849 RepID=UPI003076859A
MAKVPNKIKMAAAGGLMALTAGMISYFEGINYEPYKDVVGIQTVCAGITGPDVIQGKTYTPKECDDLLVKHMQSAINVVDSSVKVPISDAQRAALYSLTYNIGGAAFKKSTLLKKLNSGDQVGACNEFSRWIFAGGKQWQGLITRREIEKAICLGKLSE